jgi:hypothetical protein
MFVAMRRRVTMPHDADVLPQQAHKAERKYSAGMRRLSLSPRGKMRQQNRMKTPRKRVYARAVVVFCVIFYRAMTPTHIYTAPRRFTALSTKTCRADDVHPALPPSIVYR